MPLMTNVAARYTSPATLFGSVALREYGTETYLVFETEKPIIKLRISVIRLGVRVDGGLTYHNYGDAERAVLPGFSARKTVPSRERTNTCCPCSAVLTSVAGSSGCSKSAMCAVWPPAARHGPTYIRDFDDHALAALCPCSVFRLMRVPVDVMDQAFHECADLREAVGQITFI